MRYAELKLNDVANAPGVSVSFFTQGCPHHCPGCFNPETWDFDGGKEFTPKVLNDIIKGLTAQNIQRNLCILGGEPMCEENIFLTYLVISQVREKLPNTKIYIWSGYTFKELNQMADPKVKESLKLADYLIDGPYIKELRNITLNMRGSSNQTIVDLSNFL